MCDDFSCFCHHIQETTAHILTCISGEISVQPPGLREDQTDNLIQLSGTTVGTPDRRVFSFTLNWTPYTAWCCPSLIQQTVSQSLLLASFHKRSVQIGVLSILHHNRLIHSNEILWRTSTSSLSHMSRWKPGGGGKRTSWIDIWRSACQLWHSGGKVRSITVHNGYGTTAPGMYPLVFKGHSDWAILNILDKCLKTGTVRNLGGLTGFYNLDSG